MYLNVSVDESIYEPRQDNTNKVTVRPTKTQISSLIRVFAVRTKKPWVLSYPLSAQRRLVYYIFYRTFQIHFHLFLCFEKVCVEASVQLRERIYGN